MAGDIHGTVLPADQESGFPGTSDTASFSLGFRT
jgi:hypothetical protein